MEKYKKVLLPFALMALVISPLVSYAKTDDNNQSINNKLKTHSNLSLAKNDLSTNSTLPVISGIKAPTVLNVGQTGTWVIKAFDPQNGTLSYSVDWGDSPSLIMRSTLAPVFTQTGTFTHAYSNAGNYTVTFTVENDAGDKTTSTVTVHVMPSTVKAPVISNEMASTTGTDSAVITWTTDVKSSSQVWISVNSPVDTTVDPDASRSSKVLSHKINLNNLDPDTTYFVVVGSSSAGGKTLSKEFSFTTPPEINPDAPVISSITASSTIPAGELETVTINAFDPNNLGLSYSVDWGDSPMMLMRMATQAPFVQTSTFTHVYDAPGTYNAVFTVTNDDGLVATQTVVITVTKALPISDVTPPVITNITKSAGISTSTILWTTDESSDSKVFYSTSSPVDLTSSGTFVSDPTMTTDHSINISGLEPNTKYFFVVQSMDSSGNIATTTEDNFTTQPTPPAPDVTPPVISNISSLAGSSTSTISWLTDESANSKIFYSITTPVDLTSSTTPFVFDSTMATGHSLDLTGLATSTTYHYVIESDDASGNVATSTEGTFDTSAGI